MLLQVLGSNFTVVAICSLKECLCTSDKANNATNHYSVDLSNTTEGVPGLWERLLDWIVSGTVSRTAVEWNRSF